jgi:hypothetical protein
VAACLDALGRSGRLGITLVTLDAQAFFRRFGFVPLERAAVPDVIRTTGEYRIHECVGGTWMRRPEPRPASTPGHRGSPDGTKG